MNLKLLFTLFYEFFKTGLFSIGGGLATIPFLTEMGERYGWFTIETLSTMIAVSESTPGPIGINMATYVGYTVSGLWGSFIATVSLVTPSVIIICIIANYLQKFKDAKIVQMIFSGLKPSVIAFIASACLSLFVATLFNLNGTDILSILNWKSILLLVALLLLNKKMPALHPLFFILIAAIVGIVFKF